MSRADRPKHRRRHGARSEDMVGGYVELNGLRTWHRETGAGEPLVLLHPGGVDDEVTLEHTIACYRAIPDAELAIIPGTSHGLLVEKPQLCSTLIVEFLANEPVRTLAPARRRGHTPA